MPTGKKIKTFRERFSELVDDSQKTTIEIAKDLHVANQTVSAWRIGTRSPKEPTIIAIANHFGVSVAWLMGFDVEKTAHRNLFNIDADKDRDRLEALHQNPKLGLLFDRQKNMSKADIDFMIQVADRIVKENYGD